MTKYLFAFLVTTLFITSCEDSIDQVHVKTQFQGELEKRHINLQRLLSDEFTTVDDRDGGKRITYILDFDRNSKMNYIMDKVSGDTLLETLVSKYKKFWFLEEAITDSTFSLSVLSLEDNFIKGWQSNLEQMKTDQGLVLDKMVDAGKTDELLLQKNDKLYILKPEKRILKDVFSEVLDSLDHHIKLYNIGSSKNYVQEEDELEVDSNEDKGTDPEKYIKKVYPNPATNNFTIELYEEGNYLIQLFDKNGQVVKEAKMTMEEIIMDVTELEAGTYIIALEQPSNRKILDKIKLVVSP